MKVSGYGRQEVDKLSFYTTLARRWHATTHENAVERFIANAHIRWHSITILKRTSSVLVRLLHGAKVMSV